MPPPVLSSNRPDKDETTGQHLYAPYLVYVKRSILSTDLRSSTLLDRREGLRRFLSGLTGYRHFVNMPETRRLGGQPNLRKTSHE